MTTTTSRPQVHGQSFGSLYVDLSGPSTHFWVASTARALMRYFGLDAAWKFDWDRAQNRFGLCKHHEKRISMSHHLTPHRTREDNLNTILHEIAHALVGTGHGHDATWRAMARRLGAIPKACSGVRPAEAPKPKYAVWCLHCNKKVKEGHRRTDMSGRYHRDCGIRPGRLVWRNNT